MEDKTKIAVLRGEIVTILHQLDKSTIKNSPIVGGVANEIIGWLRRWLSIIDS